MPFVDIFLLSLVQPASRLHNLAQSCRQQFREEFEKQIMLLSSAVREQLYPTNPVW